MSEDRWKHKELKHIKSALLMNGYLDWIRHARTFNKDPQKEEEIETLVIGTGGDGP